jgi:hypothetical protein
VNGLQSYRLRDAELHASKRPAAAKKSKAIPDDVA